MADDQDHDDLDGLWRIVDAFTVELSARDRRAIYAGIAGGIADGWRPARGELANLVSFAVQQQAAARDATEGDHSPRYDCA